MTVSRQQRSVTIVGGGLVGSLLALFLVRRGFTVMIRERRPDPRAGGEAGGRSINLVITSRGLSALREVGLEAEARALTVAVAGRMVHAVDGALTYQPYGRDASESNLAISRAGLNRLLIEEAARAGVALRFDTCFTPQELENAPGVLFGADGAGSAVREALVAAGACAERVEPLGWGYKELLIPAAEARAAGLAANALHIWPRGRIMLMALPNLDGSFTVTLYLPEEGETSFRELGRAEHVRALFESQFKDAIPLIPDFVESFLGHPVGALGTVRAEPWHAGGRTALIGDAAHAIVPFFGQGMNCGFEDCSVLAALWDRLGDWEEALPAYSAARKPHADAIAEMALENFVEMRDRVGGKRFLLRKQVEHLMEREWPREYRSRYSMVMYGNVPYAVAQAAGRIEEQILDELCAGLEDPAELDLERAQRLVRERLTPFLERHGVDLNY